MKFYVVHLTYSYDDKKVGSIIEGVYTDKSKAISKIKEIHDECLKLYDNPGYPGYEYKDGDKYFYIYDSHVGCRSAKIDEVEVE